MNSECPLVTVVIPVYNASEFVREAINSVLTQDYDNIQIVAVDDGSSDDSVAVLREFNDSIEIITQENRGSAAARNRGIAVARGEFVAFLDADDLWHPQKLRIQVEYLRRHSDVGIIYANWLVAQDHESKKIATVMSTSFTDDDVSIVPDESGWLYTKLITDCLLHTSSVLLRRTVIDSTGLFDEALRKGQDYDYWIRASRQSIIHKITPILSIYRLHDAGITKQPSAVNYGARIIESSIERWGRSSPDGSQLPRRLIRDRLGMLWFNFGCLHENSGNKKIARDSFRRAFFFSPWRIAIMRRYLKATLRM